MISDTSLMMCPSISLDVCFIHLIWRSQWHPGTGWGTTRNRLVTTRETADGLKGWQPGQEGVASQLASSIRRYPQEATDRPTETYPQGTTLANGLRTTTTERCICRNTSGPNEMLGAGECNTECRIHSWWGDRGARPGDIPQSPEPPSAKFSSSQRSNSVAADQVARKPAQSVALSIWIHQMATGAEAQQPSWLL